MELNELLDEKNSILEDKKRITTLENEITELNSDRAMQMTGSRLISGIDSAIKSKQEELKNVKKETEDKQTKLESNIEVFKEEKIAKIEEDLKNYVSKTDYAKLENEISNLENEKNRCERIISDNEKAISNIVDESEKGVKIGEIHLYTNEIRKINRNIDAKRLKLSELSTIEDNMKDVYELEHLIMRIRGLNSDKLDKVDLSEIDKKKAEKDSNETTAEKSDAEKDSNETTTEKSDAEKDSNETTAEKSDAEKDSNETTAEKSDAEKDSNETTAEKSDAEKDSNETTAEKSDAEKDSNETTAEKSDAEKDSNETATEKSDAEKSLDENMVKDKSLYRKKRELQNEIKELEAKNPAIGTKEYYRLAECEKELEKIQQEIINAIDTRQSELKKKFLDNQPGENIIKNDTEENTNIAQSHTGISSTAIYDFEIEIIEKGKKEKEIKINGEEVKFKRKLLRRDGMKKEVSKICKQLFEGKRFSKIRARHLRKKLDPAIINVIGKESGSILKKYIEAIAQKGDLPFDLTYNIQGPQKLKDKKYVRAAKKAKATIINEHKRKFFSKKEDIKAISSGENVQDSQTHEDSEFKKILRRS